MTLTLFLLAFCFLLCIQLASCFIWECLLLLFEIFSFFIMISILYDYLFFYSLYSILHYQLFDYYHSCLIGLHWKCSIGCRTIFGELFVSSAFILIQIHYLAEPFQFIYSHCFVINHHYFLCFLGFFCLSFPLIGVLQLMLLLFIGALDYSITIGLVSWPCYDFKTIGNASRDLTGHWIENVYYFRAISWTGCFFK